MSIHERIKLARTNLGLSRVELGKRVKVSHQAVQKWEDGASAPSRKNISDLAKVLEVTVDWLNSGTESTAIPESYKEILSLLPYLSAEQLEQFTEQLRKQKQDNEELADRILKLRKQVA